MKTPIVFLGLMVVCLAAEIRRGRGESRYQNQPLVTEVQPRYQNQPLVPEVQPRYQHQPLVTEVHPRYQNQPAPLVTEVQPRPVAIVRQSGDMNYDGTFNYDFEAENGISSYASGSMKPLTPELSAQVIQGAYSYTAPDGTPIAASYYADETGFHIIGDHIPTSPPIPEAIARSLEILPKLSEEELAQQEVKARRPYVKRRSS